MNKEKYFLMHKDTVVLCIDTCEIINMQFLPYPLYNKSIKVNDIELRRWLICRAAPLDRKNVDKLYINFGLPRDNSGAFELMLKTHGLSVNDNYWIASEKDLENVKWENINLFNNKLNVPISRSMLIENVNMPVNVNNELSAEYTGQGSYAKCFIRDKGSLKICKIGSEDEINAEIISSDICELLGFEHVKYKSGVVFDQRVVVSDIETNENVCWESAFNMTTFTERAYGLNICDFCKAYYSSEYYELLLIDGLVLNSDRHLKNWSIKIDGNTHEILGMAPLYDFNRAFTASYGEKSKVELGTGLLRAARDANRVLGLDLVSILIPYSHIIPDNWRDTFVNRLYYIQGIKSNQNGCFSS